MKASADVVAIDLRECRAGEKHKDPETDDKDTRLCKAIGWPATHCASVAARKGGRECQKLAIAGSREASLNVLFGGARNGEPGIGIPFELFTFINADGVVIRRRKGWVLW